MSERRELEAAVYGPEADAIAERLDRIRHRVEALEAELVTLRAERDTLVVELALRPEGPGTAGAGELGGISRPYAYRLVKGAR